MGCPVHIWGPAAAALLPVARLMRFRLHDRLRVRRRRSSGGGTDATEVGGSPAVPLQRFAPVDPHARRG